eukprot:TRINITY_DN2776_c0_g1_i2.p1 TRINITY_DN2776_c0_g1~~TRINITY_DN2776_c0_g1_i2.p1  ORF type:complete len:851 (+),score=233.21 TRINITY_DN2776_c0_g1_i2:109-2661(+)
MSGPGEANRKPTVEESKADEQADNKSRPVVPVSRPANGGSDSDSDSDDDVPLCKLNGNTSPAAPVQQEKSSGSNGEVPIRPPVKQEKPVKQEPVVKSEPKPEAKKKRPPSTSDSDDDWSLLTTKAKPAAKKPKKEQAPVKEAPRKKKAVLSSDEDSDDEMPLKIAAQAKVAPKKEPVKTEPARPPMPVIKTPAESESDSDDDKPLSQAARPTPKKSPAKPKAAAKKRAAPVESSDSDDDVPLGQIAKKPLKPAKKVVKKAKKEAAPKKDEKPKKDEPERFKWWLAENQPQHDDGRKWTYMSHKGVLFPPPYLPHNVKMLYEGNPVDLEPEAEEAATFYAQKIETEYVQRPIFRKNFWKDWKKLLGKNHVIKSLDKCDFRPIHAHIMEDREKKKSLTKEEKDKIKADKDLIEETYGWATLDDHKEKIGNFRVEIPGLFMGRGEHPKQGMIKQRTRPEDVTLNISEDAPEIPVPVTMEGHKWGKIVHNNMVTWLGMYKDSICGETKYIFLNANSTFKGMSDLKKFEKARELKGHIKKIRKSYQKELTRVDPLEMQRSTALYLIDKLALRVGGEKDTAEEADTVGCCSLRAEHVEFIKEDEIVENDDGEEETKTKYILHLDFLGKDSIRYDQKQEIDKQPWLNLKQLKKDALARGDKNNLDLFSCLSPPKMNAYLTAFLPGLTAKVFRTYNASIVLDELCQTEMREGMSVPELLVHYNRWNRDVAILCNHQRAKPKSHDASMEKVGVRLEEAKTKLKEAKKELKEAKGDKKAVAKFEKQVQTIKDRINTIEHQMKTKEDLATVSLGTSKINYLDPRITVAWCKKHDVPLTKIFTKTLIQKFEWATDAEEDWRF